MTATFSVRTACVAVLACYGACGLSLLAMRAFDPLSWLVILLSGLISYGASRARIRQDHLPLRHVWVSFVLPVVLALLAVVLALAGRQHEIAGLFVGATFIAARRVHDLVSHSGDTPQTRSPWVP